MRKNRIIIATTVVVMLSLLFTGCAAQRAVSSGEVLSLGERYLLELDYEQAVAQFSILIEIEPMNPRGYTGLAEAYVELNRIDDAITTLQQGFAILSDNTEFLEQSVAVYEEIIEKAPENPDAYLGLSDTYIELGDEDSARAVLDRGLIRLPNHARLMLAYERFSSLELLSPIPVPVPLPIPTVTSESPSSTPSPPPTSPTPKPAMPTLSTPSPSTPEETPTEAPTEAPPPSPPSTTTPSPSTPSTSPPSTPSESPTSPSTPSPPPTSPTPQLTAPTFLGTQYDYMFQMTENTFGFSVQLNVSGSAPFYWELRSTANYPYYTYSDYVYINSSTGVLTFHESAPAGTYYFVVYVQNSEGSATMDCLLRVNPQETTPQISPPEFSQESHNYTFNITEGNGYGVTIRASGYPAVVYSLQPVLSSRINTNAIPYGISIDAYSGYLSFEPDIPPGTYSFIIVASNEAGRVGQECTLVVEYIMYGIR